MRALFDDISVLHDQDQIGVSNRGQAVRDDKARSALHQFIHTPLDKFLGTGIDIGSRFVQN